jgi:hypothetical protein
VKKIVSLFLMAGMGFLYAQARDAPLWVNKPSAAYPEHLYVSAVGSGQDRQRAETGALGALAAYFKQSVTSAVTITDTERQMDGRGASDSRMSLSIEAEVTLDALIGAEIKNAWYDGQNKSWYAAAVMEKAACRTLYAGELDKTMEAIKALINISGGIPFETVRNCYKARSILEKADFYALILAMLGGPDRGPEISRTGAVIAGVMVEAQAIPVDVRVRGDVNGRIKAAFAGAFTGAGFRTGTGGSRFTLDGVLTMAPAARNKYFNTRYTVDAVLKDTLTGTEIFTYNASSRESHPASQEDADNRAIIGAERKIREEFPGVLRDYLND